MRRLRLKDHTDRLRDVDVRRVRLRVLLMAGKVGRVLDACVGALGERNTAAARLLTDSDGEINALEIKIDRLCIEFLARWNPVASDLRFVTGVLKLVTDLERVGDLAVHIARAIATLGPDQPQPPARLAELARAAYRLLADALEALADGDPARARDVIGRDAGLHALSREIAGELLDRMHVEPGHLRWALTVQELARDLERIGDHATNVAEMVVFMVEGHDVRHAARR